VQLHCVASELRLSCLGFAAIVLYTLQLQECSGAYMRDVALMPFWNSVEEEGYFSISSSVHKPGIRFPIHSSHMTVL
jgi:hypothetical protein